MVELALVAALRDKTTIANRFYPLVVPEGSAFPCATYQRITTRRYPTFNGEANLKTPKIQLDVYSRSYGEAKAIAESILDTIGSAQGKIGDATDFVNGASVVTTNEFDAYEQDTKRYRVVIEIEVTHET